MQKSDSRVFLQESLGILVYFLHKLLVLVRLVFERIVGLHENCASYLTCYLICDFFKTYFVECEFIRKRKTRFVIKYVRVRHRDKNSFIIPFKLRVFF